VETLTIEHGNNGSVTLKAVIISDLPGSDEAKGLFEKLDGGGDMTSVTYHDERGELILTAEFSPVEEAPQEADEEKDAEKESSDSEDEESEKE